MGITNVLLTGGLGFIGSHMARLLVDSRYNVTIVDKGTYASDPRRINDIIDRVGIVNFDICDKVMICPIVEEDIDIIINFAAETMVDRSIKDSKPFVHSNYMGVWNLLEICKQRKEEGKDIRFIQIGSDESYGSTRINNGFSFKETDKLNPGNPYSASKAAADLLCLSYVNTYDLDICVTRSSNNYGPFQHEEKFIPRMIKLAIDDEDLEVYGNGDNIRDWIYVTDNCSGIKTVMEKGKSGEIYNIGAETEKTNNEIAELIAARFNVPIRYIKDRKGHDFRYSINCDNIKRNLDWRPKVSFEDGMEMTIDWYEKFYGNNVRLMHL